MTSSMTVEMARAGVDVRVLIDDLKRAANIIDDARDGTPPRATTVRFTDALSTHANRLEISA